MFTALALAAIITASPAPATVTNPYDCPSGQIAQPAGERYLCQPASVEPVTDPYDCPSDLVAREVAPHLYMCSPVVLRRGEYVTTWQAGCRAGMWEETEVNVTVCVPADPAQHVVPRPHRGHHHPRHHHRHRHHAR